MPQLTLAIVEYGGYISIVKLAVFLAVFFFSLLLIKWVHNDAVSVEANQDKWSGIVFGTVAAASLIWLVVPLFIVGVMIYVLSAGSAALIYVKHRNGRVMDYNRILTAEHIKSLFSSSRAKRLESLKSFLFITANGNEVPVPEPRTNDFVGYKTAYDLFSNAICYRTSKIALAPSKVKYEVMYLIDGVAAKQPSLDKEQARYFIRFTKHLADLSLEERRKPQKGLFNTRSDEGKIEWEAQTAGSTAGEQLIVTRTSGKELIPVNQLGFTQEQVEQISSLREQKSGIFLVTGPKKSGLSTSFYSFLKSHDAFLNSINTLEKNPSSEVPNISQKNFTLSDTGPKTFSKKLRSIIRMGPDIVGVSPCEDKETAKIAAEATDENILLYVTIEADSVVEGFQKWLHFIGDINLAVKNLIGISNQRLIRTLCDECKEAYEPNPQIIRKFNLPSEKAKVLYRAGKNQYDRHGKPRQCESCQAIGFHGRVGIFELVMLNDEQRQGLKQCKSKEQVSAVFKRAKMLYLQEQALRLALEGSTSINEIIRILSASEKRAAKRHKQRGEENKNG